MASKPSPASKGLVLTLPEPAVAPDWVPDLVARTAADLHKEAEADRPISTQLLNRLTTDLKMKVVWDELRKKKRNAAGFLHPGSAGELGKDLYGQRAADLDPQEMAMAVLFRDAFLKGLWQLPVSSRAVGNAGVDNIRKRADDPSLSLVDRQVLRRAVEILGERDDPDDPLLVPRMLSDPGDAQRLRQKRGFVRQMNRTTCDLFGTSLLRVLARIASVVFRENIPLSKVRQWCASAVKKAS